MKNQEFFVSYDLPFSFPEHISKPEIVQNIGENVILLQPMKNIIIPHINIINVQTVFSDGDFFIFLKPTANIEPRMKISAISEGIPRGPAV